MEEKRARRGYILSGIWVSIVRWNPKGMRRSTGP
jgi:hypothetical protein